VRDVILIRMIRGVVLGGSGLIRGCSYGAYHYVHLNATLLPIRFIVCILFLFMNIAEILLQWSPSNKATPTKHHASYHSD
jgi:hypothetical protein